MSRCALVKIWVKAASIEPWGPGSESLVLLPRLGSVRVPDRAVSVGSFVSDCCSVARLGSWVIGLFVRSWIAGPWPRLASADVCSPAGLSVATPSVVPRSRRLRTRSGSDASGPDAVSLEAPSGGS